jgi:hypothetical protein
MMSLGNKIIQVNKKIWVSTVQKVNKTIKTDG